MTKLNKKLLTAITAAIPKNNVRYFLNGLFIDYDHKRISATDGHCLVSIEGLPELENGKGARWVSRPAVTAFIRAQRPGLKEFDLDSLVEFASREYGSFNDGRDTPELCAECAANYPDVMRVIPDDAAEGKSGRPAFFRWEYLKLIDDIEKAIGLKWPDGAVYQLPERKSSSMKVVIEQFEGLKVTVVIAPYRVCCVNAEV